MSILNVSARESGLISCHSCHLLIRSIHLKKAVTRCPRCGSILHQRKVNSMMRTWALTLTAFILYFPANILPISTVTSLGYTQSDTILSGVIYFMSTGMWAIALIILTASIIVPLLKLIILSFLLISVQFNIQWRQKDRTILYRITEAVGRWSMVDLYVVAILVGMVNMGAIANFRAGPGAVYFAGVVVITMLAAQSFDPRLIWDKREGRHE